MYLNAYRDGEALGLRLCTVNKRPDIFVECSTATARVPPRKRRAVLTWRNNCQVEVEVKRAGDESLALEGRSTRNGAKNFNTPFVLARHPAHRLLDGHDALCLFIYY